MKKSIVVSLAITILVVGCGPKPVPEAAIAAPTEKPTETPTEVPSPIPQPVFQEYGVHIHPTWGLTHDPDYDKRQVDQAYELGARWVRIGVSWRLLEPSQGVWHEGWYIPMLDELVTYANSKGLKVIFMVAETPCWASSDPKKDCDRAEGYNKWYPPFHPGLYAVAVGFLVERFGDRIHAWEIWNEPNMAQFWGGSSNDVGSNAADYAAMLIAAHRQAKFFDPDAIILGGSIAGADVDYLEAMYEAIYAAGAYDCFDALALHPYSGSHPPDGCSDPRWSYQCGVEAIREVMLANGDERQIWFTESGWSSFEGELGVGREKQAEHLAQSFTIAQDWSYVPVIIWYDLTDDSLSYPKNREGYFGLVDSDLNRKPAADAFQKAAEK